MFRNVPRNSGLLFASGDLSELFDRQRHALRDEVEQMPPDRLLNTAPTDLVTYLVNKYSVEPPTLAERGKWAADQKETSVDVNDFGRRIRVPGQRVQIDIPFEGDGELFFFRASTASFNPPRATVGQQVLVVSFQVTHDDGLDLGAEVDKAVRSIEEGLNWIRNDVKAFRESLPRFAGDAVASRRERALKSQGRLASLGIALKAREGAPKTYAAPTVRRKVAPVMPVASSAPYAPEPTLDMENYEHILNVVQNMAHVMERSPSAFQRMQEEDLRQHVLVQLNGHFEGAATGETFNVSGKTDILLRDRDRNIFIAECKFWKGPKQFQATIDQLLSYTAWRDTKTAIFVFNKGTSMSTVLAGVKAEAEGHANYKRTEPWRHESGMRFTFHHKDDVNRELLLTVLVFDVPA